VIAVYQYYFTMGRRKNKNKKCLCWTVGKLIDELTYIFSNTSKRNTKHKDGIKKVLKDCLHCVLKASPSQLTVLSEHWLSPLLLDMIKMLRDVCLCLPGSMNLARHTFKNHCDSQICPEIPMYSDFVQNEFISAGSESQTCTQYFAKHERDMKNKNVSPSQF
jgi:hypothetical protein